MSDTSVATRKRPLIAFRYFGGKNSKLKWLLPLLDVPCATYGEPFGGSAAVLLNREPVRNEFYNDLDRGAVNFFRVLRNEEQAERLVGQLQLTLYAYEEWYRAKAYLEDNHPGEPVEWARCWYIAVCQGFGGLTTHTTWSAGNNKGRTHNWFNGVDKLLPVIQRLCSVQIFHHNALKVIELWDSPDTLLYCDPPYPGDGEGDNQDRRDYHVNRFSPFGLAEHALLAERLHRFTGKVAVSGYCG